MFTKISLENFPKLSVILQLMVCHLLWSQNGFGLTKEINGRPLLNKQLLAAVESVNSQFATNTLSSQSETKNNEKKSPRTGRRYKPHIEEDEEFCYTRPECGPGSSHWDGICENGKRQSPVDIDHRFVSHSPLGGPIYLNDYYRHQHHFWLMNSGHTVSAMLNPALSSRATILVEGVQKLLNGAKYIFAQVHFHWGSTSDIGSEHTFDGQSFAMEAHFVHYNTKYKNFSIAMEKPDGLAVFAVLFEETHKDNPALQPIVKILHDVRETRKMIRGSGLDLTSLLPVMSKTPKNAYMYRGSLTTPECHQSVSWMVFEQRLGVSARQLDEFRSLVDSNGDLMVDNFRPTQPLNGRKIRQISFFCGDNCHEQTAMELYSHRVGKASFPFIIIGPKIRHSLSKVELILSLFNLSIYIVTICWIISLLNKTNTV